MRQTTNKRQLGKQPKEVSEQTKKKILEAALTIFAREGFFNAKLREMARIAGTTHSLISHHFGSKEDLWRAVVDYGLKLNEDRLRQIIDSQGTADPVELYKKFITSYISFVAKHTELSKILLHNNSRTSPHLDYIIEKQKRLHTIIEPVFNKAQECGYFKGFDHDSFSVYVRALVETPIATRDITNKMFNADIRSEKGIALHTERVIRFLFRKDEQG
jgi:TetR/AcrR family transcriptional regulator